MDLEEWEILPDDGFLEIHDDGGKRIYSRKYGTHRKTLFKTNYFICPSSSPNPQSQNLMQPKGNPGLPQSQFVPIPLEPDCKEERKVEINPAPIQARKGGSAIEAPNIGGDDEQDTVSQVFFKKMKENEFVDMKMDSPKCCSRGVVPQPDPFAFPRFEDKGEAAGKEVITNSIDPDSKGGLFPNNIWKWSLTGIGAICSFGVAAATVCIIILGSSTAVATKKNKKGQYTQKLRFQIYTDDQNIKQVVQQASKLNDAISAVRGVPFARAQVTFGGHYDGL